MKTKAKKLYYVTVGLKLHTDWEGTEDECGNKDVNYSAYFIQPRIVDLENSKSWDFMLEENPEGNTYYLVYVSYSDGDSFHYETGLAVELALVNSIEDAEKIKTMIELDYEEHLKRDHYKSDPIKVMLENDKSIIIPTERWKGYFERLQSVNIQPITFNK